MAEARRGAAFLDREIEFAAHLRDPERSPAPDDVEDRRMQIYRDLFFNNVSNFLANGFKVLRGCMDDAAWRALIRDFYRDHASRTPLFTKLYGEFVTYVSRERERQRSDPPFLADLAHYEWVGLDLLLAADPPPDDSVDPDGDLLAGRPVLSPLARMLRYSYRVNEISKLSQPTRQEETPVYFIAYRNADDDVKYVRLNAVAARLWELLETRAESSGRDALTMIVKEMRHPNPDTVIEGGHAILRRWRELGVVPGTRRN